MSKQKALFIYTRLSTFVKGDLDILSEAFSVTTLQVNNTSQSKQLLSLIRQLFFLLFNIRKYDFVYIWFADYHSFLPILFSKLAGKRSYLVIGGYDVCRIKKVRYGSFVNPIRGYCARFSMSNATLCLCVSNHIERIVRFISKNANTKVVYNCVTLKDETPYELPSSGILSVTIAASTQSIYVKGVDRIIALAGVMQEVPFTLIGVDKTIVESICGPTPSNLTIVDRIAHEELISYYKRSKVYCQMSRSESFALSLAEAMYYNCIPVVANTGGMPEVTGGLGYIVDANDIDICVKTLYKALEHKSSGEYRKVIREKFSVSEREASLKELICPNIK
ncbi:MAG: glycosyltransferase family 4 protein [Rikenellaceae bacterium]|nr:glycosyltransferase family 4 protein [Rikenellaceae bacterium]